MSAPKKRYFVITRGEKNQLIDAEDCNVEDGYLRLWADGRMVAWFAPSYWLSCTEEPGVYNG